MVSNGKKKTIYDIANITGVSTATISRVINNSPKLDYETCRKILNILKELNYRPKMQADYKWQ